MTIAEIILLGPGEGMSGGVLFLYVDAKSIECNEAYEF